MAQTAESAITTHSQTMDNGEARHRMMHEDGSGYIRTEAGLEGAWQNAHYHKGVRETYIVQTGWMAFATMTPDGDYSLVIYQAGGVVSSQPGEHHNVYLPAGAVIHTVKHSDAIGNPEKGGADWYEADSDFDAWTKGVSEEYMKELSDAHVALFGRQVEIDDEVLHIVAVGSPNPRWLNQPPSCAVRFDDGTCGVFFNWVKDFAVVQSDRLEWNDAVRNSVKMPTVGALGSGVMNVWVTNEKGEKARLRMFFNDKADMADSIGPWKAPEPV